MKRIFFVALAATLLAAGCQKTEIINPANGNALTFSTNMGKLTKAGQQDAENSGEVNLQEQNFRVWAYCAYEDANTTATELNTIYDKIANLDVTYTPATDAIPASWGTAKEYFWPGVGKELKFFAVSDGKASTASTVSIGEDINSMTIADFEVKPGAYNTDLMVADFVQQHQGDKVVDLKFHHALSKIQFVFKTVATGDATVYVQDLVVKGLETKGTLNVAPKAPASTVAEDETTYVGAVSPIAFTWSLPTSTADAPSATLAEFSDDWTTSVVTDAAAEGYDADFPAEIDGTAATEADKVAMKVTASGTESQVFTTWLMLPQSIESKKVEITYLINERKFTSIFPLETASLKAWADNQYVKYTITLAPNLISFNPSVEDWTNPEDVDYQN